MWAFHFIDRWYSIYCFVKISFRNNKNDLYWRDAQENKAKSKDSKNSSKCHLFHFMNSYVIRSIRSVAAVITACSNRHTTISKSKENHITNEYTYLKNSCRWISDSTFRPLLLIWNSEISKITQWIRLLWKGQMWNYFRRFLAKASIQAWLSHPFRDNRFRVIKASNRISSFKITCCFIHDSAHKQQIEYFHREPNFELLLHIHFFLDGNGASACGFFFNLASAFFLPLCFLWLLLCCSSAKLDVTMANTTMHIRNVFNFAISLPFHFSRLLNCEINTTVTTRRLD